MSAGNEAQARSPRFEDASKIGIAQLSPETGHIDQLHIEANVALIWPYSSSTRRLSLLLAEKDVRLRKTKGQVKVTFHDDCAREVAKTQIGIGDTLKLGLRAATWIRTGEVVSTPGKKVDWDVDFDKSVLLELERRDSQTTVVDFTAASTTPPSVGVSIVEMNGPKTNGLIDIRKARLTGSNLSPAHHKHNRLSSGSFVDATLDPFADDDVYISGRSRKRTKFARYSGAWQLTDTEQEVQAEPEVDFAPVASLHGNSADEQTEPVEKSSADAPEPQRSIPVNTEQDVVDQTQPESDIPASVIETVEEHTSREHEQSESTVQHTVVDAEALDDVVAPDMRPPDITASSPAESHQQPHITSHDFVMTPTPVLRPILSSGLALISPLVERRNWTAGYFPTLTGSQSELDAISHPATESLYPTDHNSLLGHPSTTNAVQPEQYSSSYFNFGKDVQQEMLLEGHNVNDLLGSGLALQNRIDDIVADLLEDTVLSEQNPLLGHSPTSSAPARTFDVDLDALQQQIDESSQLWQESLHSPEVEDRDMYGPSSTRKDAAMISDQDLEVVESASSVEEDPDIIVSNQIQSEVLPIDVTDEKHTSSDRLVSMYQQKSPRSPVLIESSDEDESYSEEEDVSSDAKEVMEETSTAEEEAVILAVPQIPPIVGPQSPLSAPTSIPDEMPSPVSLPVLSSPVFQDLAHQGHSMRTDGTDEVYESERQRDRVRNGSNINAPAHQPTLASQPGSPQSTGSDAFDDGETSSVVEERDIKATESDDVRPAVQSTLGIAEQIILADTSTAVYEIASTTAHDSHTLGRTDNSLQLITPDATQQDTVLEDLEILQPSELLAAFPPTPILTQATQKQVMTSLPTGEGHSDNHGDDDDHQDVVEPQISDEHSKPLPRTSRRLSRKSFTSEKIFNEYFTPRRSSRNLQLSPTFVKESLLSALQPPSPTSAKRMFKSSPALEAQEQVDSAVQGQIDLLGRSTPLSYYPYLLHLHEFYNQQTDVLATCAVQSSQPQKAKSGPKDNCTILCLVDPSLTSDGISVRAQLFRPRKEALPTAKRGDVVLLRNMKVQTHERKTMLLSTDSSSWAVFKQSSGKIFDVATNGPPIEFEDAERAEAERLLHWWHEEGETKHPELGYQDVEDESTRDRRSVSPIITRSQARKGNTMEDPSDHHGISGSQEQSSPPATVPSSPTTRTKRQTNRRVSGNRSGPVVHELRDGVKYIDNDDRRRSASVIHELRDGYAYVDE